jgi:hypothetical protein
MFYKEKSVNPEAKAESLLTIYAMAKSGPNGLQTRTADRDQANQVIGLLNRLIPDHSRLFAVTVQGGAQNDHDKVGM